MVKFIARISAQAGSEEIVAAALRELVGPSQAETGCILYQACRQQDDATELVVLEEWASAEALDEHMATPHFKGFLAKVGALLDGPPTLEYLEAL